VNVNTTLNYLTNSAQAVQRFAGEVIGKTDNQVFNVNRGANTPALTGPTSETIRSVVKEPSQGMGVADVAASAVLDAMTNETRKDVWRFTNMHRMAGDVGQYVAPRLGLDSPSCWRNRSCCSTSCRIGALSGQFGSPLARYASGWL
jgi:hypothetical protein